MALVAAVAAAGGRGGGGGGGETGRPRAICGQRYPMPCFA